MLHGYHGRCSADTQCGRDEDRVPREVSQEVLQEYCAGYGGVPGGYSAASSQYPSGKSINVTFPLFSGIQEERRHTPVLSASLHLPKAGGITRR